MGVKRNTAGKVAFLAVDASGVPQTGIGGTLSCTVSQDHNTTPVALSPGTITEAGNGVYFAEHSNANVDFDHCTFLPESSTGGIECLVIDGSNGLTFTDAPTAAAVASSVNTSMLNTFYNTPADDYSVSYDDTSIFGTMRVQSQSAANQLALNVVPRMPGSGTLSTSAEIAALDVVVDGVGAAVTTVDGIVDTINTNVAAINALMPPTQIASEASFTSLSTAIGIINSNVITIDTNVDTINTNVNTLDTNVDTIVAVVPAGTIASAADIATLDAVVDAVGVNVNSAVTAATNAETAATSANTSATSAATAASNANTAATAAQTAAEATQARMPGSGTVATVDDVNAIGSGSQTAGGLRLQGRFGSFNPVDGDYIDVVQGEQKKLLIILEAVTGALPVDTPLDVAIEFADVQSNKVTIANADVTRVLSRVDLQVYEITLTTANTAALSAGALKVEVTADNQKARLDEMVRIIGEI